MNQTAIELNVVVVYLLVCVGCVCFRNYLFLKKKKEWLRI